MSSSSLLLLLSVLLFLLLPITITNTVSAQTISSPVNECGTDGRLVLDENTNFAPSPTRPNSLPVEDFIINITSDCDITIRNLNIPRQLFFGYKDEQQVMSRLNITIENIDCLPPGASTPTNHKSHPNQCIHFRSGLDSPGKIIIKNVRKNYWSHKIFKSGRISTITFFSNITNLRGPLEISDVELSGINLLEPTEADVHAIVVGVVIFGGNIHGFLNDTSSSESGVTIYNRTSPPPVPYPTFSMSNIRLWNCSIDVRQRQNPEDDFRVTAINFQPAQDFSATATVNVWGFLSVSFDNISVSRDRDGETSANTKFDLSITEYYRLHVIYIKGSFTGLGNSWTPMLQFHPEQSQSVFKASNISISGIDRIAGIPLDIHGFAASNFDHFEHVQFNTITVENMDSIRSAQASTRFNFACVSLGTVTMTKSSINSSIDINNLNIRNVFITNRVYNNFFLRAFSMQAMHEVVRFSISTVRIINFTSDPGTVSAEGTTANFAPFSLSTVMKGSTTENVSPSFALSDFLVDGIELDLNEDSNLEASMVHFRDATESSSGWLNISFDNLRAKNFFFRTSAPFRQLRFRVVNLNTEQISAVSDSEKATRFSITNIDIRDGTIVHDGDRQFDFSCVAIASRLTTFQSVLIDNITTENVTFSNVVRQNTAATANMPILGVQIEEPITASPTSYQTRNSALTISNILFNNLTVNTIAWTPLSLLYVNAAVRNFATTNIKNLIISNLETTTTETSSVGALDLMAVWIDAGGIFEIATSESGIGSSITLQNIVLSGWTEHNLPRTAGRTHGLLRGYAGSAACFRNIEKVVWRDFRIENVHFLKVVTSVWTMIEIYIQTPIIGVATSDESLFLVENISMDSIYPNPGDLNDINVGTRPPTNFGLVGLAEKVSDFHSIIIRNLSMSTMIAVNYLELVYGREGLNTFSDCVNVATCKSKPLLQVSDVSFINMTIIPGLNGGKTDTLVLIFAWRPDRTEPSPNHQIVVKNFLLQDVNFARQTFPHGSLSLIPVIIKSKSTPPDNTATTLYQISNITLQNINMGTNHVQRLASLYAVQFGASPNFYSYIIQNISVLDVVVSSTDQEGIWFNLFDVVSPIRGPSSASTTPENSPQTSFLVADFLVRNCTLRTLTAGGSRSNRLLGFSTWVPTDPIEKYTDVVFRNFLFDNVTMTVGNYIGESNPTPGTVYAPDLLFIAAVWIPKMTGSTTSASLVPSTLLVKGLHFNNIFIFSGGYLLYVHPLILNYDTKTSAPVATGYGLGGFTLITLEDITINDTRTLAVGNAPTLLMCVMIGAIESTYPSPIVYSTSPRLVNNNNSGPLLLIKNMIVSSSSITARDRTDSTSSSPQLLMTNVRIHPQNTRNAINNFANVWFQNFSLEDCSITGNGIREVVQFVNIMVLGETRGAVSVPPQAVSTNFPNIDEHKIRFSNFRVISCNAILDRHEHGRVLRVAHVMSGMTDGGIIEGFTAFEFEDFDMSGLKIFVSNMNDGDKSQISSAVSTRSIDVKQLMWSYGEIKGTGRSDLNNAQTSLISKFVVRNFKMHQTTIEMNQWQIAVAGVFLSPSSISGMNSVLFENITIESLHFSDLGADKPCMVSGVLTSSSFSAPATSLSSSFSVRNIHLLDVYRTGLPGLFSIDNVHFSRFIERFISVNISNVTARNIISDLEVDLIGNNSNNNNTDDDTVSALRSVSLRLVVALPSSLDDSTFSSLLATSSSSSPPITRTFDVLNVLAKNISLTSRNSEGNYIKGFFYENQKLENFDKISFSRWKFTNITILRNDSSSTSAVTNTGLFATHLSNMTIFSSETKINPDQNRTFEVRNIDVDDISIASSTSAVDTAVICAFFVDNASETNNGISDFDVVSFHDILIGEEIRMSVSSSSSLSSIVAIDSHFGSGIEILEVIRISVSTSSTVQQSNDFGILKIKSQSTTTTTTIPTIRISNNTVRLPNDHPDRVFVLQISSATSSATTNHHVVVSESLLIESNTLEIQSSSSSSSSRAAGFLLMNRESSLSSAVIANSKVILENNTIIVADDDNDDFIKNSKAIDFYSTSSSSAPLSLENTHFLIKCNNWPRSWNHHLLKDFNEPTSSSINNNIIDSTAFLDCRLTDSHSLSFSKSFLPTLSESESLNLTIPITLTKSKTKLSSRSETNPTNSSSRSISIPLPPPKKVKDAISHEVTALGMFLTAFSGGAVNGMNARKIIAISSLADCGKDEIYDEDIPPVEPDSNPLFIRFGSSRFASYRGSIIGAVAFVVLWLGFMSFLGFLRAKVEKRSVKRGLRKVGVPGTMAVPGFSLLPVAVNSAAAIAKRYDPEDKLDMFAIVFAALTAVVLPLVCLLWIVKEVRAHEVLKPPTSTYCISQNENNNNSDDDDIVDPGTTIPPASPLGGKSTFVFDDGSEIPKWKQHFDWLTEPKREYKRSRFRDAYGPVFDGFTTPIFVVVTFVLVVAAEGTEGAVSLCSKGDRSCCETGLQAMLAISIADVISIIFFTFITKDYVFLVRSDAVCVSLCAIIAVVNSTLIILQFYGGVSEGVEKSNLVDHTDTLVALSQVAFYLAMIGAGLAILNEIIGAVFELRTVMRMRNAKEKREDATKKMFDSLELVMIGDADAELLLDGATTAKKKREGKERNNSAGPPGRKRENSGDTTSTGGNLCHSPLLLNDGNKKKEDHKRSNHERARSNTKTTSSMNNNNNNNKNKVSSSSGNKVENTNNNKTNNNTSSRKRNNNKKIIDQSDI